MDDIFISYAREDRDAAKELAEALQRRGWSVWWDRKIPPGKTFDQAISAALDAAKCVVVLWSQTSIHSDWVKEEASEGLRRGILIPVLISEVSVPLGFRRMQAAQLVGKHAAEDDPEFQQLMQSIATLLDPGYSEAHRSGDSRNQTLRTIAQSPGKLGVEVPVRLAKHSILMTWLRRWLIWGPIIGAVSGFVLGAIDDRARVLTPELFGTWVVGGAAWGLLGGAAVGLLFGVLIQRYDAESMTKK